MRPVIYVVANKRAHMSAGKLAAQVGHAVSHVFSNEKFPQNKWMAHPHRWMIVLQGMDDVHLMAVKQYLKERGVESFLVVDEGLNEVRPFTYTALGVQILDKDSPEAVYLSGLRMYKEEPKEEPEMHKDEPVYEKSSWWQTIKGVWRGE